MGMFLVDDPASIYKIQGLTEWFVERENDVNIM